jgi:hypothetical protein
VSARERDFELSNAIGSIIDQRKQAKEKDIKANEAADKRAKEIVPLLAERKDVGETVCHPSGDPYGQVEQVHNDKIEVREHVFVSGFINVPGRNYDKLDWINYNEAILCDPLR